MNATGRAQPHSRARLVFENRGQAKDPLHNDDSDLRSTNTQLTPSDLKVFHLGTTSYDSGAFTRVTGRKYQWDYRFCVMVIWKFFTWVQLGI